MNVKNPAFILAGSTYRNLVFRRQCVNVTRGQHRRVVVTGLGLVTPLGVGVTTVWQNLVVGKCGITRIEREDYDNIPAKIAAFVPRGENPGKLDKSYWQSELKLDKRSTTTEGLFAVVAAHEAIADSKWMPEDQYQRERTGPNYAVSTACAAGAHAIGDAYRMISYGDADVMVTGGVEACIVPVSMAGFCKMRALTTKFNDRPHEASRPFDSQRSGFVMGEGAGVMILEEHEHAVSRGAKIYAEIIGYGLSGDAYHITAPSEGGYGAYLAMKNALGDARLEPQDIHYINAHATSTPIGDAGENNAIKTLLGSHAKNIKVSSVKGAIGHLLGASGAVEAIFTVLSVAEGVVPPTLNLHSVDSEEEFDLNYVPLKSQQLHAENARTALTNSFGFGGTNASLCFRQFIDSN
ncbi:3-oxoacyl-[acyl-carrier-protein] synthase, mitochondrial-like isoform X3 [Acropora muricata]|uniref:3-oxoacyl-[acyl-carrier-protein] synthase, mitochondrial-like isoform X3 n=1 Tax=Acropora muricata TaxID=159855 RepID=UPI0034E3BDC8